MSESKAKEARAAAPDKPPVKVAPPPEKPKVKMMALPQNIMEAVLKYLSRCPYGDVSQILAAIQANIISIEK